MSIVTQISMFSWEEIEELGDLRRLQMLIEHLPDDKLLHVLQKERSKGRDDYPVVAMWHAVLAGVVFQHSSSSSLVRELSRNAQLRSVCGFRPFCPPTDDAMGRFLEKLIGHESDLRGMADELITGIRSYLPDYGCFLAMDSKAIASLSPHASKKEKKDNRREQDGDYGHKEYRGKHQDGSAWSKVVKWFGFKLHLIVDAKYELPLAWSVTPANVPDNVEGKSLVNRMMEENEWLKDNAEYMMADKGYDDGALLELLDKGHQISPVIDKRASWKEKGTRHLEDGKNVSYDEDGSVYCYEDDGKQHLMANGGYDKERRTLKKLCPAKAKGISCKCSADCTVKSGIRIKCSVDKRIFTPVDRTSHKWKTLYNMRSSVERVNSRLDRGYGFEIHTIRGIKKMRMRCSLALLVMLGMAYGYLEENQPEKIRKLVG